MHINARFHLHRIASGALLVLALAGPTQAATQTTVLSDNSAQASTDVLTASAGIWLAADFISDANYDATSTLQANLLASTGSGTAQLTLYSSDSSGLVPGSAIASFTNFTSASNAFTLSGVGLAANTHYWLVLSNADGASDWAWSEISGGTGVGYTGVWANSDDAGATWFSNSSETPLQFALSITAVSAVPEPAGWACLLAALPLLAVARRRAKPSSTTTTVINQDHA